MSGKRLHPLHNVEFLASMMEHTGCYPDPERRTGRTTAQALAYLAEAMQHPYTWIYVEDHHGTANANDSLQRLIRSMVDALGLKHFAFKPRYIQFGSPL